MGNNDVDLLVVGSHPDDIELGMGGTICQLVKAGRKVVLVDLTDGEPTPMGTRETRAQETKAASQVLGITERIQLGLKNRELADTLEARRHLANVIRRYRPSILCAHYWDDAHPDHVAASSLTDAARFYAKLSKADLEGDPWHPRRILYYLSVHLRVKVLPSFIFDVSASIGEKGAALTAYRSQFIDHAPNKGVIDRVLQENAYWGSQIGVEYGEPFVSKEHIKLASVDGLLSV